MVTAAACGRLLGSLSVQGELLLGKRIAAPASRCLGMAELYLGSVDALQLWSGLEFAISSMSAVVQGLVRVSGALLLLE